MKPISKHEATKLREEGYAEYVLSPQSKKNKRYYVTERTKAEEFLEAYRKSIRVS